MSEYLNATRVPRLEMLLKMEKNLDLPPGELQALIPEEAEPTPLNVQAQIDALWREVRTLREALAAYIVVPTPPSEEMKVSEDPSKPAAEEPLIYRLVREELNKFPGGANIPMEASDTHAQLYDVGGDLTEEELRSVAATLARRRWIRWNREHGLA
jgi:hypothetical protein